MGSVLGSHYARIGSVKDTFQCSKAPLSGHWKRAARIGSAYALALTLLLPISCANPAPAGKVAGRVELPIMHIYHSRCGACHVPVEPGTRTSAELQLALAKHRKRVRLTELQWAELTKALAAPRDM